MENFKIILPYLKRYKKDVVCAIIAILVSAFSGLYQPKLLENIQKALMANQKQAVLYDGIWLVVLGIIAIISGIFNVYFAAKIAQGVVSDLREDTYAKIQTFSFGNIKKFSAGSLTYTVDQRYEPGNEHDDAAIYADVAVADFNCRFIYLLYRDYSALLVGTSGHGCTYFWFWRLRFKTNE